MSGSGRVVILLSVLIACVSCKKEIEPKPAVKTVDSVKVAAKDSTPKYDTSIVHTMDSTMDFIFRAKLDSTQEFMAEIQIDRIKDGSRVQTLFPEIYIGEGAKLYIEDYNSDGKPDFKYQTDVYKLSWRAEFWIYNSVCELFELDSILSRSSFLKFDIKK